MEYFLIITLIIIIDSFAFALPVLLYYCYVRVRSKGYRAPGEVLAVTVSWTAVSAIYYEFAPEDTWRSANLLIYVLHLFWIPTLLSAVLSKLIIGALPTRNARLYGARQVRIPFFRIGQGIVALAIVAGALCLLVVMRDPTSILKTIRGWTFAGHLLIIGLFLVRVGHRAKSTPAAQIFQSGAKTALGALYLRSFKQESQCFVIGAREKYQAAFA